MGAGPLSARVAALCDETGSGLGPMARSAVRDVRRRLDEPLRVAIAGRLKAGKSTLVNAMIGRRVAPTAAGECTRVVTQFRYGTGDRVEVVRRDGSRVALPLDEAGMIPLRLGVPRAEISFVDVTLATDNLRTMTVVDTPGLSSTNAPVSQGARRALLGEDLDDDSAGAIRGAEAVVYVFTQAVREDDRQALETFQVASAQLASNPINAVGVLNKADKLVAGPADPWPVAGPLAVGQARLLHRVVCDVVPAVGLLAETTEAGRLTAADCEALRRLTGLDAAERGLLLASVDLFTGRDCPVPRDRRQRLLTLLDLYGIGFAMAQLARQPRLASGELVRLLYQASGFPRLRHTLDEVFRWRVDAIKAGWALATLQRVAGQAGRTAGCAGDRDLLRSAIERVLRQPEYHRLRLLEVAQQVSMGTVELPEPLERELTRLALSTDPGWILGLPGASSQALAEAALEAATRWRVYAVAGASPAQARVAHVAHRGFFLLSRQARDGRLSAGPGLAGGVDEAGGDPVSGPAVTR